MTFRTPSLASLSKAMLAPLEAKLLPDWPQAWGEFATIIFVGLRHSKCVDMPADKAVNVAIELVQALVQHMGGSQPYIPRGSVRDRQSAAQRIVAAFNGSNFRALAAAEGISESRVRQIVGPRRKRKKAARPQVSEVNLSTAWHSPARSDRPANAPDGIPNDAKSPGYPKGAA